MSQRPNYWRVPPVRDSIGSTTGISRSTVQWTYNMGEPQLHRLAPRRGPAVSQRGQVSQTHSTDSMSGVTLRSTLGEGFHLDSFESFHNTSRISTLRKSPACIVWPGKPAEEKKQEFNVESKTGHSKTEHNGKQEDIEKSPSGSNFGYVKDHNFWDKAVGGVRIDSEYIGAPRPDPYHSKWSRDERRCFFISDSCRPPHWRENLFSSIPYRDEEEHISFRAPKDVPMQKLSIRKSSLFKKEKSLSLAHQDKQQQ